VTTHTHCTITGCDGSLLVLPRAGARCATLYEADGRALMALALVKECVKCHSRQHVSHSVMPVSGGGFLVELDPTSPVVEDGRRFYSRALLQRLSSQMVHMHAAFAGIARCFNEGVWPPGSVPQEDDDEEEDGVVDDDDNSEGEDDHGESACTTRADAQPMRRQSLANAWFRQCLDKWSLASKTPLLHHGTGKSARVATTELLKKFLNERHNTSRRQWGRHWCAGCKGIMALDGHFKCRRDICAAQAGVIEVRSVSWLCKHRSYKSTCTVTHLTLTINK
jgi:hypothetical protein